MIKTIDLRGDVCPKPVIVTLSEISKMKTGDVLEILTDEKIVCETIPDECRKYGMSVDVKNLGEKSWKIIIKK
ncbi:MAG: sulfurtransferase TusA family protein [Candidatus Altiarchaeota archaeon]